MLSRIKEYRCDLCGSLHFVRHRLFRRRLGLEGTKFDVASCRNCGLASIYPLPSDDEIDRIYSDYAVKKDRINVENERLRKIYPAKLKKLSLYTRGKRLLDIGAGLGTFVYAAKNEGFDAIGIEYEKGQCETAVKLWNISLINGRIEDIYKRIGKFDIINLHHVLEHVKSPRCLIEIICGLLNAGGICVIEVPNQFFNINDNVRYLLTKKTICKRDPLDHLYFFSIRTLKRYVKDRFELIALNQFIKEDSEPFRTAFKRLYRALFQWFDIGVGGFIEIYIRKKN